MKRLIYNKGYYSKGIYYSKINGKQTKVYDVWKSMLRRCYCKKSLKRDCKYEGCFICEEWLNFQVFAQWFHNNYIEGYSLDKDILIKGNKVYSPETCCFIPITINSIIGSCTIRKHTYLTGIRKTKNGKYQAKIGNLRKTTPLGTFDTREEANKIYIKMKEKQISQIAELFKDKIDKNVYNKLKNYKLTNIEL